MVGWRTYWSQCLYFLKVRDLEERLVEKEHELKQMKRNLDESEGAIAQVTRLNNQPFPFFHVDGSGTAGLTLRLVCAGV